MKKIETYNRINKDSKLYLEYIIKRDYFIHDQKYLNILNVLDKTGMLFVVEHLLKYDKTSEITIYDYNYLFKGVEDFLKTISINVIHDNTRSDADFIIALKDEPSLPFIYNIFDDMSCHVITCDKDEDTYMIVPMGIYLNESLRDTVVGMKIHINEYDNLEFIEDYNKYKDIFYTFKVVEE